MTFSCNERCFEVKDSCGWIQNHPDFDVLSHNDEIDGRQDGPRPRTPRTRCGYLHRDAHVRKKSLKKDEKN